MAAGNAIIGALRAVLGIDTAQFETGLKSAQSHLSGFGAGVAKAGAVAAVAFAAAGAAVAVAMKGAIDNADKLNKASQKIGVPIEELSALKFAAELSDVSLESLTKSMGKLSKAMVEAAAKPTSDAALAFRALGVSVTDSGGKLKSSSDVLQDIAGKFEGLKDGAGKTAVSMAIFGKSGAELIPLLNSGKAGMQGMMDEARQLGIVIDTKTGKAAEAFNDNLKRLGAVKDGIITKITAGMLPALENLSANMVQAGKDADALKTIGETLGGWMTGMVSITAHVSLGWQRLGVEWQALRDAMQTVPFTEASRKAWEAFNATGAETTRQFEALRERMGMAHQMVIAVGNEFAAAAPKLKDFNHAALGGKNALDQFIASQKKAIEGQQAELQTIGKAVGAKEALKVTLQGNAVATEAGIKPNEAMRAKLAEVAAAAGDVALKLQGAQLVQQNLAPGQAFRLEMENNRLAMVAVGATSEQIASQAGRDAEKFGMSWSAIGTNIAGTAGSLSQLSGTFAKENKSMGALSKAFGIGQAIINTQIAITKALATLPPPASYAAVAFAVAQGAAAVASIGAQKFATGGAITVPGGMGGGDKVRAMVDVEPGEQLDIWRPDNGGRDPRRGGDAREVTIRADGAWRPFMEAFIPQLNAALRDGHELKLAPV